MDFKLILLLSLAGLAACSTMQDPFIHDSPEDQIAVESAARRAVVEAPAHLRNLAALRDQEVEGEELAEPLEDEELAAEGSGDAPEDEEGGIFVLSVGGDSPPGRPAGALSGGFQGFASAGLLPAGFPTADELIPETTRPGSPAAPQAFPSLTALSLLGGYGFRPYARPIILLQPIFIPVPMGSAGDAEGSLPALTRSPVPEYYGAASTLRRRGAPSLLNFLRNNY